MNILIPDGETDLSLRVLSCLSGIKYVKIHILSRVKWVETRFSKNSASFNYFPESITEVEWIAIIKSEIIKKKINVLLPVYIKNIRLLCKYKKEFNSLIPDLVLPSIESLNVADNKWELYQLLKKHDINRPFTVHSESKNELNIGHLKLPVLIKPLEGFGGGYILKINDKKSLLKILQKKNNHIIQNYIKGYDIDMSVLCQNGKILAATIQKGYIPGKSPYQPSLGVEFLYNKELYQTIEKLMQKLNWSGVAHIDLRYDEVEKNFKVIEINPRFWGSVVGSDKVGVNFPYLYCLTSLGIDYNIPEYRFERYTNNRGFIRLLKSKISNKNKYPFPKNVSIKNDFMDPFPKIYKYTIKIVKKIFPKVSFLKKFKYGLWE